MHHTTITANMDSTTDSGDGMGMGVHCCVSMPPASGSCPFPKTGPTSSGASVTPKRKFLLQPVGTTLATKPSSCRSPVRSRSKAGTQQRKSSRRSVPRSTSQQQQQQQQQQKQPPSSVVSTMPLRSLYPDYAGGEDCSFPKEAVPKVGPVFNSGPPHVQCNGVYDLPPIESSPLPQATLLRQEDYRVDCQSLLRPHDLSPIESSESDQGDDDDADENEDENEIQHKEAIDSSMSSRSTPQTDLTSLEEDDTPKSHPNLLRETCDERVSDYLKSLASKAAEEHTKRRTLSGPASKQNEVYTTPISHSAIDYLADVSVDSPEAHEELHLALREMNVSQTKSRRNSALDMDWELQELRRHKEERQRRAREKALVLGGESRWSVATMAAKKGEEGAEVQKIIHQYQTGPPDDHQQAQGVCPPLLGDDIVFPVCQSPVSFLVREPMCHGGAARAQSGESLWHPMPARGANSDTGSKPSQGGLWNGCCTKSTSQTPPQQTKLITPSVWRPSSEILNPPPKISVHTPPDSSTASSNTSSSNRHSLPASAPLVQLQHPHKPRSQQDIEREFNDKFVTQIYDYVSLGYPCLARDFDEEISRTSGIPIKSLQRDDLNADEKGYIKPPRGDRAAEMIANGKCVRWVALRSYIYDWARRQGDVSQDANDNNTSMGTAMAAPFRKGSWGS